MIDYGKTAATLETMMVDFMELEDEARHVGDHKAETLARQAWQSMDKAKVRVEDLEAWLTSGEEALRKVRTS